MSVTAKLKEIWDGWKNDAFPTKEIVDMANERAHICANCPLNVNNVCSTQVEGEAVADLNYQGEERFKGWKYNGCGCPLSKKTKSPTSKCPLGKW